MKISSVAPPYESYLLLGRVQAVVGYIDAEVPELEAKAGGPGSLSILLGSDYGWKVYGSGLFTSEAMMKDKPDLVKRFVKAYGEAFDYVVAHPRRPPPSRRRRRPATRARRTSCWRRSRRTSPRPSPAPTPRPTALAG